MDAILLFLVLISLKIIIILLFIINKKHSIMAEQVTATVAMLAGLKASVGKLSDDLKPLIDKVTAVQGEIPTADEWAQIQGTITDIKSSVDSLDETILGLNSAPALEPAPAP